jgi:predicted amidohydrolase
VLAEAGSGEEVLYAEIDRAAVTETRREFPVLQDRRLRSQATFG